MKILGISCFYHDSAVALVEDGRILFAIQEERLSRVKHDAGFPQLSISRMLERFNLQINDIDIIVFYEKPDLKLRRIFDQVISSWPRSWEIFNKHLPKFYDQKYPIEKIIRERLGYKGKISFCEHHKSHAAAAFFTSSFNQALVITIDGVGEYDTTTVYAGENNFLKKIAAIKFPDSLGLFYSVFTDYLGFEVNEGEYKVMGLAPYGKPIYTDKILDKIIFLHDDGSFHLDLKYFDFNNPECHYKYSLIEHLGIPVRTSKQPVLEEHKDLAASVQKVLEMAIKNLISGIRKSHPCDNVCFGGGVALNCTANAQVIRDLGIRLHVHAASGDAGGALGAALSEATGGIEQKPYRFPFSPYLGLEYSEQDIITALQASSIPYRKVPNIASEIARRLAEGKVVAILHGRDEWGPRALGGRSILADPRQAYMKDHLNAKIKFREEFRPFAPVVMEEYYGKYFETLEMKDSPHMLFTHNALLPDEIPAVVHSDNTSRVQTVSMEQNPYLYSIISEFKSITGVPILINTSFNLRGEPIVSSPSDALKTFYASGIDLLAIENFLVAK